MSVDPDPQDLGPGRGPRPMTAAASPHPHRALHLRPSSMGLVFVGGALGTAARHLLTLAVPSLAGIPLALLGCNLVGALLLGVLLESLARRGPDVGIRRASRLLLGTGVLGGFTSYSSLAVATAGLLRPADGGGASVDLASGLVPALGYGLGSVLLGVLAASLGIALAGIAGARREPEGRA